MKTPRVLSLLLAVVSLSVSSSLWAQLGPPNALGVSVGHVHLLVRDVEAHKKLWVMIGAEVSRSGTMMKFPGLFVALRAGEPTDGSAGSTVDHFGLMVNNLDDIRAKLSAQGLKTVQELDNPRRWVTEFPDKVKVEFAEDRAQKAAVIGHHLHIATNDLETLRSWYVKTFGGAPETRRGFLSAVFNGGEVNLLPATAPRAPTKGRSLDHIGFEVKGLEAFCKKLEAQGVKFDTPFSEPPALGFKIAFLTDPAGTRIELTEGLAER